MSDDDDSAYCDRCRRRVIAACDDYICPFRPIVAEPTDSKEEPDNEE